jgi:hypothetical protein
VNREQLENFVISATGRSDKSTFIRTTINMALREISAQRLWSDLMVEDEVTLAADTASVALASDVARVIEVRVMDDNQSKPLIVRPKTWIIQRVPDPASRSPARPCYGYLQGANLYVIPYADEEYEISYTYYRLHPELSASTDEVLIRGADNAVAALATHLTFKSIEKHDDAAQWLNSYGQYLASAIKLDKSNSVVQHKADQHGDSGPYTTDYWLDPFVDRMP